MKALLNTFVLFLLIATNSFSQGFEGYYQYPAIHNKTIVFSAEGDLWKTSIDGGVAQRLTTHAEQESHPSISPDGKTLAFSASYEGPTEIYTMPIDGGIPTRWTFERDRSLANTWTPSGEVVYDTRAFSTLYDRQLVKINPKDSTKTIEPLAQASEAAYSSDGKTVYFVRPNFHGNVTKRYKGGTARQIWKYTEGAANAVKLTDNYTGGSHSPMVSGDRVFFISDRDGTMNLWSMKNDGSDKQQHTEHKEFDVRSASISMENIAYHRGADIWIYNIENDSSKKLDIRIESDLDQLREKWVENPKENITNVNISPDGDRITITARGKVFIVPTKGGRVVDFTDKSGVRYRDANFSPDGKSIYVQSDETGEFEFVKLPANGIGKEEQLSNGGDLLRNEGLASPDNKWIAYDDIHGNMYILNLANGLSTKISTNTEGIGTFSWSSDSRWLAFEQSAYNTMTQIQLYNVEDKELLPVTTDRANSFNAKFSPDNKFLYFLSDRNFTSLVGSPWGPRQPEPYFDVSEKLYVLPLQAGYSSPFRPNSELTQVDTSKVEKVVIDEDNILRRIVEVPIKAGNYSGLMVNDKALYLVSRSTGVNAKSDLMVLKIDNESPELKTMLSGVRRVKMSADGKKLLVQKGSDYYVVDAGTGKIGDISESKVKLSGWKYSINPAEDWKQIFKDAWRMERDYFYDSNMHGVDWDAMYEKYLPLVDRISTRTELSDLIGRFVGELSVLHTSVRGGDTRSDEKNIQVASLGARFKRDAGAGGYRIEHIYTSDPDYPDEKSPLDDPYLNVKVGDVVTSVNGASTLSAIDIGELLRNEGGKQVLLGLKSGSEEREIIVTPTNNTYNLQYNDWEYSRRLKVEEASQNKIGYVHLRAMGSNDLSQWYRDFYPVYDRPGLIIDVRHNRGGNIESFILEKLLRKDWMYWAGRSGRPSWNMQYAFRGHIVVLVDEVTASDGEAFAEGFKRLDLGTTIGARTWGGEVWLSGVNRLTDNGIARAPMNGVYGEEGEWLIEGHGFVPDIIVINKPHETFMGKDAQLEAAIELLEQKIKEDPRTVPSPPKFPDMSFGSNAKEKK